MSVALESRALSHDLTTARLYLGQQLDSDIQLVTAASQLNHAARLLEARTLSQLDVKPLVGNQLSFVFGEERDALETEVRQQAASFNTMLTAETAAKRY